MSFKLSSSAFAPDGSIPSKFTCEGEDISPQLSGLEHRMARVSLALIVDDPDAPDPAKPQRVYVHWVVYNISDSTTRIAENAPPAAAYSHMARYRARTTGERQAYGGPCPPIGKHRYFFKLYALDDTVNLKKPTKAELEKAMEGHILGQAELVGTYARKNG